MFPIPARSCGLNLTRRRDTNRQATDPRWDCVHFRPVARLTTPIGLERCKHVPGLETMVLINNSRLSVQPVSAGEWQIICDLGGVAP